ncbi:hypothetical protein ACFY1U_34180 [Streptomyces sp. NPDC001351]
MFEPLLRFHRFAVLVPSYGWWMLRRRWIFMGAAAIAVLVA